jgi:hypothetical protein
LLQHSPLLTSLGVRHGFTTRIGGVSAGRFHSLNLGDRWGDEPDAVRENLRRVSLRAGFAPESLCQVNQVHGTDVVHLRSPERRQRPADGMSTQDALTLGVYSADCVPILLADGQGRVAAVHAGWRGTVAGIATQAVHALTALGAEPNQLRAALFPSIGPCCFEVQEDVASAFRGVQPDTVRKKPSGRLVVDLWQANRELLLRAGLRSEHIEDRPACTCCDATRFFSYRRDGAGIGQHMAFIVGGGA